ncbi:MAG: DpnI domain-containing protein [Phocaeicola sp.]|uniref:DpnI domain-containing protein n=1 Tax=Phocaeicola TaxID=909656 RepID=UPI00234F3C52|nr:DpnI domain-containing protein [Phocaeicola oris]MCE2615620.1 hypothetical protein [Phocaeicola oris]
MMDLLLNTSLRHGYHGATQIARVETEDWVYRNMYCPICGEPKIIHYEANKPVADFYCNKCSSDFELKSKESRSGKLGRIIKDGAYATMIERITSLRNPNFFFMSHHDNEVVNFVLVPNAFFNPSIIIKRKPLSINARRSGWVGCDIDISSIPNNGKIYIIKDKKEIDHEMVRRQYLKSKEGAVESKGWLMDVLNCIDKIGEKEFLLQDVYDFTPSLQARHPNNNNVEPKIRQQLQILRDKGFIEFTSRGQYTKLK